MAEDRTAIPLGPWTHVKHGVQVALARKKGSMGTKMRVEMRIERQWRAEAEALAAVVLSVALGER